MDWLGLYSIVYSFVLDWLLFHCHVFPCVALVRIG